MFILSSWPCLICTGLRGFVSGFLGRRRSSDVSYLVKCGVLVGESIFCRGMGGLGTGARQLIVSIGDLDRVGEVLGDGHEGEQLIGVHGVGKEVVIWPSSILTTSTGAVGGGQPGEEGDEERSSSSATVPSPGVEEEDGSDSVTAKILFLTINKHEAMKSRSSRMSPGSGRKPGLDW